MIILTNNCVGEYKLFRKKTITPVVKYFSFMDKQYFDLKSTSSKSSAKRSTTEISVAGLEALHRLHQLV